MSLSDTRCLLTWALIIPFMIGGLGLEVPIADTLRSSSVCHIRRKCPPASSRYHAVGLTKVMHQKQITAAASRAHRMHRAYGCHCRCMLLITPRAFCRLLIALYLLGDDSMPCCSLACERRNMLATANCPAVHALKPETCRTRALKPHNLNCPAVFVHHLDEQLMVLLML